MGIHAATEAELAFDGVEITEDDILLAGNPADTSAFKVCCPTSITSAAATPPCVSGPPRALWSMRCGT